MHIGIIGCGQLARLMALSGWNMGLEFSFLASEGEATRSVRGLGRVTRFKHDRSAPIEITAEALEVRQADQLAVFTGDVIAGQGTLRLTADEMDVWHSAWTFDHFYPINVPDTTGPCLEGWMTLAGLAQATSRIRIGCMVTGVVYRHPAVLANMASTLDVMSDGRLELGIGAGR